MPLRAVWQGCMNIVQSESFEMSVSQRLKTLLFGITAHACSQNLVSEVGCCGIVGRRKCYHNLELKSITAFSR